MCLCSKNLAYFPFMHCPLVAKWKARWSIKAILIICHPCGIYLLQLAIYPRMLLTLEMLDTFVKAKTHIWTFGLQMKNIVYILQNTLIFPQLTDSKEHCFGVYILLLCGGYFDFCEKVAKVRCLTIQEPLLLNILLLSMDITLQCIKAIFWCIRVVI